MLTMIIQIAVAFVATVSFAVLFQVPKEQYVYSGICGAAGWWCYLLVMANYPSPTVSSFAAVVVLTIMARVFAVYRKTPVTVFWMHLVRFVANASCRTFRSCQYIAFRVPFISPA